MDAGMDDDDKVRRNLMVLSSAVLLYAWLDLPASFVTQKLLGIDAASAIAPWKVWAPLLVAQLYQAHRYWALTSNSSEWTNAVKWFQFKRAEMLRAMANAEIADQRRGWRPRFLRNKPPPQYAGNGGLRDFAENSAPSAGRRKVLVVNGYSGNDPWYQIALIGDLDDEVVTGAEPQMHLYITPRWQWLFSGRLVMGMVRTPHFSHIAIPVLLSYLATCFVASRLCTSILDLLV